MRLFQEESSTKSFLSTVKRKFFISESQIPSLDCVRIPFHLHPGLPLSATHPQGFLTAFLSVSPSAFAIILLSVSLIIHRVTHSS